MDTFHMGGRGGAHSFVTFSYGWPPSRKSYLAIKSHLAIKSYQAITIYLAIKIYLTITSYKQFSSHN